MRTIVCCALFVCLMAVVSAQVPSGFQPITPLPGQNFFGGRSSTKKANPTPKPTPQKPTKKPVTTKAPATPRPVTPAPVTPALPSIAAPTLAPSAAPPTPKNCGLNINVPQANCNGGNSAVQQTLAGLKQQLDLTRQQHQAQNTAVQAMITKLQGQQTGYISRISDLQNEVRNLIYAFNNLNNNQQPSSTVSPAGTTTQASSGIGSIPNAALLQAIQSVRHDMGQTVNDFNGKLLNLTLQTQTNQLQDAKLHTSVEAQIQSQARDIGRLTQQVTDLNRILQQLNLTSGSVSGTGATSADVAKLNAEIQQVAADLKQYDTKQQAQLNTLNQKTSGLQATVTNHTSEINSLRSGSAFINSRINTVQKDVTVVHDALAQFRQSITPKMNKITSDVSSLTSRTNKLESDTKSLGLSVGALAISISGATSQLQGLTTQTANLKNTTAALQKSVNDQGTELLTVKLGLITMKNIVPSLQKMNNAILTGLNNGGTPTSAQLNDINTALGVIINKLNQINLNPAAIG